MKFQKQSKVTILHYKNHPSSCEIEEGGSPINILQFLFYHGINFIYKINSEIEQVKHTIYNFIRKFDLVSFSSPSTVIHSSYWLVK